MEFKNMVTVLAILVTAATTPVPTVDAQASVELINLIGDPITATCGAGAAANRGAARINPNQVDTWSFDGGLFAMGWTCHFEWSDSSDCAAGPTSCTLHTQDIKVWQGFAASRKLVGGAAIALTPCADCLWQIKVDGFYRADKSDRMYTFIAAWN